MIDVEVSDTTVTAVDVGKNEVRLTVDDWEGRSSGPGLDRRVDETIAGTTTGLDFQDAAVSIKRADRRQWTTFDDRTHPVELPAGPHVVQVGTTISVYVSFADACRLSRSTRDGTFSIAFDDRAAVTIGFRSHVDRPRDTITVPRSIDGSLTAIRHLASAIDTGSPEKSYPTKRSHPPRIRFGDTVDIPDSVRLERDRSDINVAIPPSLGDLLVAAPLVYYLRADATVTDRSFVSIEAPSLPDPLDLGTDAPLEADVAALVQRVFYLDCLVRNGGSYHVDLQQTALLAALSLEMDELYGQSEAERLRSYLEVDFATIAGRLPDWHLSVVVEPSFRSVRVLPHVLARMGLIQLPNPEPVEPNAVISESVEQSYAQNTRHVDANPTHALVRNGTRLGIRQGWMADGAPVDGFRATLSAFENRFAFHEQNDGPRRVLVVINDGSMLDERAAVERIYRSRSNELTMEVTVVESLRRDELRERLRSPVDFLHYIGHCDPSGLRCEDGTLSTATIDDSAVQTFFLNACGSFDQGLQLVRNGSVAGAVTLANVLNPEATQVGVTFARLLMHGFTINYALSLASRQVLTNKFYTVVGDGTHRLSQGDDTYPADLRARSVSADEIGVEFNFPQLNIPGGLAKPALPTDSAYVLRGCSTSVVVGRSAFADFLDTVNLPVVYEDGFYWSTELSERLREGPSGRSVGTTT